MECALLGFGYWGKIIEKYITNSKIFSLKYIYSPSLNNGVTIEKIIKDNEIECVFICTPINTHYELAKKALLNKKHVFCEKPLCKEVKLVHELIDISRKNKLCLYTNYIYAISKSIDYIKENLKSIGKINYIKAEIKQFGNFYKCDNVYDVIGVHMISAIIYILGKVDIDFNVKENIVIKRDRENVLDGVISFEIDKEINGIIECSLATKRKSRTIEFIGENGSLYFDMLAKNTVEEIILKESEVGFNIEKECQLSYDESNNLSLAINDFYNKILEDKDSNLELSLKVTEILEKIDSNV